MALTGRAVLLVLLGLVPLALAPSGTTVRLWALLVVVLAGLDLLLAPSPRRLRLERRPVAPVRRFDEVDAELLVTNDAGRRVRVHLRDAWQPSAGADGRRHRLRPTPGATSIVTTRLRPTRRGDRLADLVTVRTFGPLGLLARQRSFAVPGTVRVLPEFRSRRHLPGLLRRLRDIEGRAAVRVRGRGSEFDSLRDWVEGDDVRSIDWRATARRRATVVRTWRPERDRHVLLALDTSRTSAVRVGDAPALDGHLEAALLLAALAAQAGDHVGLVAGDLDVRARVQGVRRGDVLPRISDAVCPLEPALLEADFSRLLADVVGARGPRSLVVVLTTLDPVTTAEGLVPILPVLLRRHRVLLASVRDPELDRLALGLPRRETEEPGPAAPPDPTSAAWLAAAAQYDLTSRERTADALRRLGVDIVDAAPDELAPALADRYLQLKDRGLL